MMLGVKLRSVLPGIHIRADKKSSWIVCGRCSNVCPMEIDIMNEISNGRVNNQECVDHCPKKFIKS